MWENSVPHKKNVGEQWIELYLNFQHLRNNGVQVLMFDSMFQGYVSSFGIKDRLTNYELLPVMSLISYSYMFVMLFDIVA